MGLGRRGWRSQLSKSNLQGQLKGRWWWLTKATHLRKASISRRIWSSLNHQSTCKEIDLFSKSFPAIFQLKVRVRITSLLPEGEDSNPCYLQSSSSIWVGRENLDTPLCHNAIVKMTLLARLYLPLRSCLCLNRECRKEAIVLRRWFSVTLTKRSITEILFQELLFFVRTRTNRSWQASKE